MSRKRDPRKDRARKRRLRRREAERREQADADERWWLDWERSRYGQLRSHWGESRRPFDAVWPKSDDNDVPF